MKRKSRYTHGKRLVVLVVSIVFGIPMEVRLLRREYFNRWYSLKAYYAALTFSSVPVMLTLALIFMVICYLMSGQLLEWDRFVLFAVCGILTALCSEGLGLAVGSALSATNGSIVGPATAAPLLALCCYGMGFGRYIETSMKVLMSASYLRYGISGFSLALWSDRGVMDCPTPFCLYSDPNMLLRDLGMDHDVYYIQVIALLVFTVIHRVLAYMFLRYRLTSEYSNKLMVMISKFLKHTTYNS